MVIWPARWAMTACAANVDYLDAAEVGRLLAHAEEHGPPLVCAMIATCIYAGLRRGELAGLRWRDLDFAAGRLTVARSYRRLPKGGKIHHLPLHPELARVLRQWRERCPQIPEGLVFPIPGRRGYRMLNRAELLGLPELLRGARCPPQTSPGTPCGTRSRRTRS
jgi:integrase